MTITLTPELEKLINEAIKSGDYDSPNEVLRESLLWLNERKLSKEVRRENLRREVQKGIDAIREGQYKTYQTDELDKFADDIISRGMKKLHKKNGEK